MSSSREAGNSSRKVFRPREIWVFTVLTEMLSSSAISLYFLHSMKQSCMTCEQRSGRWLIRSMICSISSSRAESSERV